MFERKCPPLDSPMFAHAVLGGKKNSKLDIRISDELKEGILRRWKGLGLASEAEYIDLLASIDIWGFDHVRSMRDRQLLALRPMSDSAPTNAGGAAS